VGLNFRTTSTAVNDIGYQAGSDGGRIMANALLWTAQIVTNAAPVITVQPQSVITNVGATVTFSVTALGTPLAYQWRFNGTNIPASTASICTITNVQPSQAGSYSVLVSNAVGWTLSSNALLALDITVRLSLPVATANGFQFRLTGPVGIYVIQASTNVANWVPVATNNASTGLWDYTDPSATAIGRRFYRALLR
jgi:hypothetical protein